MPSLTKTSHMEILGAGNDDIWYKSSHQLSSLLKMIKHLGKPWAGFLHFDNVVPASRVSSCDGGTFSAHFMSAITHWYEVMLKLRVGSISAANCRRLWPSQGIAVGAEFADKGLHNCTLDSRRGSSLLTLNLTPPNNTEHCLVLISVLPSAFFFPFTREDVKWRTKIKQ